MKNNTLDFGIGEVKRTLTLLVAKSSYDDVDLKLVRSFISDLVDDDGNEVQIVAIQQPQYTRDKKTGVMTITPASLSSDLTPTIGEGTPLVGIIYDGYLYHNPVWRLSIFGLLELTVNYQLDGVVLPVTVYNDTNLDLMKIVTPINDLLLG